MTTRNDAECTKLSQRDLDGQGPQDDYEDRAEGVNLRDTTKTRKPRKAAHLPPKPPPSQRRPLAALEAMLREKPQRQLVVSVDRCGSIVVTITAPSIEDFGPQGVDLDLPSALARLDAIVAEGA